jgi:hypothetical protein
MKINVTKVITRLGGVAQIVGALSARFGSHATPTEKAVEKWRERGIIPMSRWLQLHELAKASGIKLQLEKFLTR